MTKRILHVVGDSQFGGGSVLILRMAQEAASRGYQVDVLTTNPKFQEAILENGLGVVQVDCIWRQIRPLRDLMGLWRLYVYLKKHRYDIVHTHTSKGGFIGRTAAFLADVSVIVHTVHGFAFHEESSPMTLKVYAFLERFAAKLCTKIVTVSKYHRAWALDLRICRPDRIIAIPNGVSPVRAIPTVAREELRAALGLAPGNVVLVSAGRLAPQKGIEYLIDAVSILVEGGMTQLRVVLAGDGPLREDLENRAKESGLEEYFIFLGFRSDVADILNAGDIAVMPTLREGLSISLLEAMALGKPIVTTTIGSNLEVTEHGRHARLVKPKDVLALAVAISDLVADTDSALKLGESARSHFNEIYTEQVMLNQYMQLYADLSNANCKATAECLGNE